MAFVGDFRPLLAAIKPRRFSGTVYRVIGSRFLDAPLTSAGSKLHGGRFNPPGSFEVLYTALAVDTALAEREGILLTAAGVKAARGIRTSIVLRIDCRLESVLDLTEERVRQQLRLPLADILGPWLPWNVQAPPTAEPPDGKAATEKPVSLSAPSQRLGVAIYGSRRIEAVLAPSAKDGTGRCLAIFPDRLQPGSFVTVDDPDGRISAALGIAKA